MEAGPSNTATRPSLHDDLLQTLQETGIYEYAQDIDLIQNGQLAEVRMHEDMKLWPTSEGFGLPNGGLTEEDLTEGQMRIAAASSSAEAALAAARDVRNRVKAQEASFDEDGYNVTPNKPRKPRRGPSKGPGDAGGRSSSKGLRHFSMKVCEKVEGKGRTTYNEVADELVNDLPNSADHGGMQYDEKNIRRRVYDALNVLMAMDIISREKKEIFWRGLPQGPQVSLDRLRNERVRLLQKIEQQSRYITELAQQQAIYQALMIRNGDRSMEQLQASQPVNGNAQLTALPLPFVIMQVSHDASVEIQISDDDRQAIFDFGGAPYQFQGDEQVLREMNLCGTEDVFATAPSRTSPIPSRQQSEAARVMTSRAHPVPSQGLSALSNAAAAAAGYKEPRSPTLGSFQTGEEQPLNGKHCFHSPLANLQEQKPFGILPPQTIPMDISPVDPLPSVPQGFSGLPAWPPAFDASGNQGGRLLVAPLQAHQSPQSQGAAAYTNHWPS